MFAKKYICLIILLTTICNINLFCVEAEKDTLSYSQIIAMDFDYAFQDLAYIGNRVINISAHDFYYLSATALVFSSAVIYDEDMRKVVQRNKSTEAENLLNIANSFGNIEPVLSISPVLYFVGLFSDNEKIRTSGRLMAEALLISGTVTQTMKIVFGRARPFLEQGSMEFKPFEYTEDHFSLPSGHASSVFTMAAILSGTIDTWWSYAAFFPIAGMTAYARVYKDKHWVSDVLLGAGIGTLSGYLVLLAEKNRKNYDDKNLFGLHIFPTLNGIGLAYSY